MKTAITTAMITATLVIMGSLAMAQTASQKHAADLVRVFLVECGLDANIHAGEVVDYGGGNVVDSRDELFIGYALMDRPLARSLAYSPALELLKVAQNGGFKTVAFADDDGFVWEWDLTKGTWRIGLICPGSTQKSWDGGDSCYQ
jgi:hypothetical protein